MGHGPMAHRRRLISVASVEELHTVTSRRDFLRLVAAGGALALLPSLAVACADEQLTDVGTAGSGDSTVIDFAKGDTALLQFALVLEQLEADFYSRVVAGFTGSNITAIEQAVLTEIRDHELAHRDLLREVLGADGGFTIRPIYSGLSFGDRAAVLARAKSFEELGVGAYNGMARYFSSASNLSLAAKIVSVEGRHASTIGSLLSPRGSDFAPKALDDALALDTVAASAQAFIIDRLAFANAPVAASSGSTNA